jgi:hypothetical protein
MPNTADSVPAAWLHIYLTVDLTSASGLCAASVSSKICLADFGLFGTPHISFHPGDVTLATWYRETIHMSIILSCLFSSHTESGALKNTFSLNVNDSMPENFYRSVASTNEGSTHALSG